jgi:hypothetical protein
MDSATSTDTILPLWNSPTGPPDEEWIFWQTLAATSLSDTTIPVIMEESGIGQLASYEEGKLNVIEVLFIEYNGL